MAVKRKHFEFTPEVRKDALKKAGYCCEWCGSTEDIQLDHIIPIYLAARMRCLSAVVIRSLANARCLCESCHILRHTEDELDKKSLEMLVQAVLERYRRQE